MNQERVKNPAYNDTHPGITNKPQRCWHLRNGMRYLLHVTAKGGSLTRMDIMKDCYRAKMYGQYSYWSHLCDASAAIEAYNGKTKLEIKLNGEWA